MATVYTFEVNKYSVGTAFIVIFLWICGLSLCGRPLLFVAVVIKWQLE